MPFCNVCSKIFAVFWKMEVLMGRNEGTASSIYVDLTLQRHQATALALNRLACANEVHAGYCSCSSWDN